MYYPSMSAIGGARIKTSVMTFFFTVGLVYNKFFCLSLLFMKSVENFILVSCNGEVFTFSVTVS